jgi:DNA-directed RNA polymerase subunit M/transcription elongation factor TFIIS
MPIVSQQAPIISQSPPVVTLGVEARTADESHRADRRYWPVGDPLPAYYQRRQILPCPKCRRIRMSSGGQATVATGLTETVAYLRCRACKHTWKLAVQ